MTTVETANSAELINRLQTEGVRLVQIGVGAPSRHGGAGPSDHKAMTIDGTTFMAPVHTTQASDSPYIALPPDSNGRSEVQCGGQWVGEVSFPKRPAFYDLETADGIPYWKIATLHSSDVLATTVFQTCLRYEKKSTACKFCAIGRSLREGRTIARKTPAQLAEVARAAVELDGVKHMVMTTGTPNRTDRGARALADCAQAIRRAVDLPIQAQCEPPDDDAWFHRMHEAGVDTLGMHLEVVNPQVRRRVLPGKCEVTLEDYFRAFESAVSVFGKAQVTTYIIAGLGDTAEEILQVSRQLIALGVYPFVVPLTPISGTPVQDTPAPSAEMMRSILQPLGRMLVEAGMTHDQVRAGCARCGACSALSRFEEVAK
ncbi:MAG: MSMEG_0568 family radical SAM protein [Planctomycetota bacterium]